MLQLQIRMLAGARPIGHALVKQARLVLTVSVLLGTRLGAQSRTQLSGRCSARTQHTDVQIGPMQRMEDDILSEVRGLLGAYSCCSPRAIGSRIR